MLPSQLTHGFPGQVVGLVRPRHVACPAGALVLSEHTVLDARQSVVYQVPGIGPGVWPRPWSANPPITIVAIMHDSVIFIRIVFPFALFTR